MNMSLDILRMRAIITITNITAALTVNLVAVQPAIAIFGIPAPSALATPVIIAFIVCSFYSLLLASSELDAKRNSLNRKFMLYVKPLQR